MTTQFKEYRGQREIVLDALKKKYQTTKELQAETGLGVHQLAVALSRLRREGLVESRRVLPKKGQGGYPYQEHRRTDAKELSVVHEMSPSRASRKRTEPTPPRPGSKIDQVLQALSATEENSVWQIENKTGLNSPAIRHAIHYLQLRGYRLNVAYRPDPDTDYAQPVGYYRLLTAEEMTPEPQKKPRARKAA